MYDILVTPHSEDRKNTDVKAKIVREPGGSGANFASWFGSIATTDQKVNFVGRVGALDLEEIQDNLKTHKVNAILQADTELATGTTITIIRGNTRSFFTDRGANANLQLDAIPDHLFQDLLYLSGYSLLSASEASIRRLIQKAQSLGTLVACDPGSAGFIEDFGSSRFLRVIEGIDILLPNLEEAMVLSGQSSLQEINKFLNSTFPILVVTLGENGVAVSWSDEVNGRLGRHNQGRGSLIVEARPSDLIDPTGAGDAFAAAFISEYLRSFDLKAAAISGIELGGKAVSRLGGRPTI